MGEKKDSANENNDANNYRINNKTKSKSFEYKTNITGRMPNDNNILDAEVVVPLKYLSNFWRSPNIPLINCKLELKLKLSNYCLFSAAGNDNANGNDDNIIFTIKGTKLYVPVVTLSVRDNQKLTIFLSKGFEISFYWNEYKMKKDNKIQQMSIDIFSNQILLELTDCLF